MGIILFRNFGIKQLVVLSALLLTVGIVTPTYAIGIHNVLISIGGGFNYATTDANENVSKDTVNTALGGGYIIELGYLYLNDVNDFVHGVDIRLSFGQNFDPVQIINGKLFADMKKEMGLPDDFFGHLNSLYVQVGVTYQVGFKIQSGRLMLDVLGLNLGYFSGTESRGNKDGAFSIKLGNSFLIGINLPLGVNYIFDSGFIIGFRHRIDLVVGAKPSMETPAYTINGTTTITTPESGSQFGYGTTQNNYIAYNLVLNIGFVFGK